MKTNKVNLGKVCVTIDKDYWDINKDYDKLVIVEVENAYATYISRQPVPHGIDIENKEYWCLFSRYNKNYLANEGIFNVSKYLKIKDIVSNVVPLTLTEAIAACPSVVKNAGQIITFIDKNKEWQRYQYQGYNVEHWNQLTLWKDLNNVSEDIPVSEDVMIFNITEYMPGGSKYKQAIWAGIYTIDGNTPVSQYRLIFGCDESLGDVEGIDMEISDTLAIIDISGDEVDVFSYILFVGNSIDGYRYQTTINSDEEVPDWIAKAFGDNSSYIAANIASLERRVNAKFDNKVDKVQGKGLSTNDFTNANVSELANSVVNAIYNSNTKKIVFTKNNSETIEIDATPFIKDGMIDEVKIENGYLVIVFNTDSGKETIRIALADIFNPDNYYTKAQANSLLGNKVDKEPGKGLSTNDYTTEEKTKVANIPTALSELTDDATHRTVTDVEKATWNNKGTISGITMNGESKGTSGVVDLGTVLTTVATLVQEANLNPVTSNAVYQVLNSVELIIAAALNDLKDSIPENVSDLTNDSGFISSVKTVNGNTITGTGDVSVGTITGITMNNVSKGTSGVVNLGTVLTSTASTINASALPVTAYAVQTELKNYEKKFTFVTKSESSVNAANNCYYIFTSVYNDYTFTLPTSNVTNGWTICFQFTTGSNFTGITWNNGTRVFMKDFNIQSNKTYEIVAIYIRNKWLITATEFE